jgi:hypothetical protein
LILVCHDALKIIVVVVVAKPSRIILHMDSGKCGFLFFMPGAEQQNK